MDAELERLKATVCRKLTDMAIQSEAARAGTVDHELVLLLIDRTGVTVDLESEAVSGASEAVQRLVAEKPYLFASLDKKIPAPPTARTRWQRG